MNYAEDRLDRRARSAQSPGGEEAGSTQDQLAGDLRRARDVFQRHSDDAPTAPSLRELRAAHELAGKTLRDGGHNKEAVFHFGMAWRMCNSLENADDCKCDDDEVDEAEHEWRACGDYAQMCELTGFPEAGILALLFYRAGGRLEHGTTIDTDKENEEMQQGCGCGFAECGASPCYIAFPYDSQIMDDILQSLDFLSINPGESFPSSSDTLAHLAYMTRKADAIGDPIAAMHAFMSERHVIDGVPPILQYWDNSGTVSDDNDGQHHTTKQPYRELPPVILLLLLKLMYASPVAGPFLQLACLSLPYLAGRFPPNFAEGRMLARDYKSHHAYYVFIRVLILGERVKKHKRGKVIRQTPVWDVVFGVDAFRRVGSNADVEEKKEECGMASGPSLCYGGFSDYCRGIFRACASRSFAQSTSPNPDACPKRKPSMPCISQYGIPSYSMHRPIFVVGDSHVLSLAWQTLRIQSDPTQCPVRRTLVPYPATGMKAWHARPSTRFFTHSNVHACLRRLPPTTSLRTIILSAGEIDCREGIGGSLLQGYYRNCSDAVEQTVIEYLTALAVLAEEYNLQILAMPVAPHAYRSEKNGKSLGRAKRRETMHLWNEILRKESANEGGVATNTKYARVYLLDYEERLLLQPDDKSPVGYVLHPSYNADYTHANSAILPLVEDAIMKCGCQIGSL